MAEDIAARLKDGSGEDRDVDDLLAKLWFFYKARHSRGKAEETMPFGKQGGAWHLVGVLLDAIKTIDRLRAPPMTAKSISELVERLRMGVPVFVKGKLQEELVSETVDLFDEAADALEHLEAENAKYEAHLKKAEHALLAAHNTAERLRETLLKRIQIENHCDKVVCSGDAQMQGHCGCEVEFRAALGDTPAGMDRQGPRTDGG